MKVCGLSNVIDRPKWSGISGSNGIGPRRGEMLLVAVAMIQNEARRNGEAVLDLDSFSIVNNMTRPLR